MDKTKFRNLYLPTQFIDVKNFAQEVEKEFDENLKSLMDSMVEEEQNRIIIIIKGRLLIKKIRDPIISMIKNPPKE